MGLVLDLKGEISVQVSSNSFNATQNFYETETDFCEHILDTAPINQDLTRKLDDETGFYQMTHLFSFNALNNSSVVLNGNSFYNLSIAGPLITVSEEENSVFTALALVNNTFNLITG